MREFSRTNVGSIQTKFSAVVEIKNLFKSLLLKRTKDDQVTIDK